MMNSNETSKGRGQALLTREQCSALRGIAITGIFLHHFLHWLGPMIKECEFTYIQHNVDRLVYEMAHPSDDTIFNLISFFGHYGVPVFLFLSGYGLVLKYERGTQAALAVQPVTMADKAKDAWQFVWKHFKKFFPMMMFGFVAFVMVDWITPGRHHWEWHEILSMMTMTVNLYPEPDHVIWPGPYWFFGYMMQFYIVYRLLIYKRHWGFTAALIAACWLIQTAFCDVPESEGLNSIRYNFVGGMLPFGMGVLAARYEDRIAKTLNKEILFTCMVVSILMVVVLSLNFHAWLWVPLFVVTLHVSLIKLIPKACIAPMDWMGALSSAIFVCHPITRKIFIPISRGGDILDGLVLYIVATMVLAMLFRMVLGRVHSS